MASEKVLYEAVIPLDPKSKKNNQTICYKQINGKEIPFIAQGKIYKQYEREAGWYIRSKARGMKPIDFPVNVKCIFYRQSKRTIDLPNLQNAICDILVKYRILADDCRDIVFTMDGSKVLYDKNNPRTEITITQIEEEVERWRK